MEKHNFSLNNADFIEEEDVAVVSPEETPLYEPGDEDFEFDAEEALLEADGGQAELTEVDVQEIENSELSSFEAVDVEDIELVEPEHAQAVIEALLFATDRPLSLTAIKQVFKGTNVKSEHIRKILEAITVEYAGATRGIYLAEVSGGYQLRTKVEHVKFLKRIAKNRPFKLSGPALEVLAIVAYKQPVIKHEIDEIRGVESGHLLRALMEKSLVKFDGKSDLPGKPMLYVTTRKFLEIFGLRNIHELPTLSEIDDLLPDGIGDQEPVQLSLSDVIDTMREETGTTYSQGEEELVKITEKLSQITTSTAFFENEKLKMRAQRDVERAQNLSEALLVGEEISEKDKKWLEKYKARQNGPVASDEAVAVGSNLNEIV